MTVAHLLANFIATPYYLDQLVGQRLGVLFSVMEQSFTQSKLQLLRMRNRRALIKWHRAESIFSDQYFTQSIGARGKRGDQDHSRQLMNPLEIIDQERRLCD